MLHLPLYLKSKQKNCASFAERRRRPPHHRPWDSPSECIPSDFCCFWKLTATGAVFAVTTPDALLSFSSHTSSKDQDSSRPDLMTPPRHCGSLGMGDIPLVPHTPSSSPASSSAEAELRQRGWMQRQKKIQMVSGSPCLRGNRSLPPNLPDGERVLIPKSTKTPTVTTPRELPCATRRGLSHVDGTTIIACRDRVATAPGGESLEVLSWGWGGQFRLGTGRERQELSPQCLHQEMLKVRHS